MAVRKPAESWRGSNSTQKKVIEDGSRAGAALSAIRALFKKEVPTKEWLDMNEVIPATDSFLARTKALIQIRYSIRTDLAFGSAKLKARQGPDATGHPQPDR